MRFKVNDIVKISKKSKWYGKSCSLTNPKDMEGKILTTQRESDFGYFINVKWKNGHICFFTESDLGLVRRPNEN